MDITGKSYDIKASLMDYSARWYSPVNGRFTTQDSWTGDSFLTQTLNRYAYALNNPVNVTDHTGHIPCMQADNGELYCSFNPPDDWGTPSGPGNGGGGSDGGGGDSPPPYDTWEPPTPTDGGDPELAPTREQIWTQKVLRFLNASGTQEAAREALTTSLNLIPFISNI